MNATVPYRMWAALMSLPWETSSEEVFAVQLLFLADDLDGSMDRLEGKEQGYADRAWSSPVSAFSSTAQWERLSVSGPNFAHLNTLFAKTSYENWVWLFYLLSVFRLFRLKAVWLGPGLILSNILCGVTWKPLVIKNNTASYTSHHKAWLGFTVGEGGVT